MIDNTVWLSFAVALGIGLLIGMDRERHKGTGSNRASAGIRTFTIASLLGAISICISIWLLAASILCVTFYSGISYSNRKELDPGLTTEIALLLTVLLGGLAIRLPSLAASLGVCVAIILSTKTLIHEFVRSVITQDEINDFLIISAATLIVLPLVPNQFIGPFNAINPRNLWLIVILVMLINALGHISLRCLGDRIGLPIVGLISGFVSSIATIGSMGERARTTPALMGTAVAGAMLSNLATIFQISLLVAAINPLGLRALAMPLIFGGVSVGIYSLVVTLKSIKEKESHIQQAKNAFGIGTALMLAAVIAVVLVASAALKTWFGQAGLVGISALAGLADAHAPTISVSSLAASGKISSESTVIPILVAFSINSISKAVTAIVSGGRKFSMLVIPGLIVQVSATWLGWWLF